MHRRQPHAFTPNLAELYRQKVERLHQELNRPELRTEAARALRDLIDEVRLLPENGGLEIELWLASWRWRRTARSPSRVAVTGCRQRWLRGHATALICCFRPASQLAARILGKGAGGFLYQIVFSAVLQMAAHRFRTSFSAEV